MFFKLSFISDDDAFLQLPAHSSTNQLTFTFYFCCCFVSVHGSSYLTNISEIVLNSSQIITCSWKYRISYLTVRSRKTAIGMIGGGA